MRRRLSMVLGTVAVIRDVVACAITGREPDWATRVRELATPPVTARPDDEAWAGLSSRLWPATTVGRA
jgi:hypothetical protein